ncbi:MAG: hypothetical protein L0K86_27375 [Actinomycetia bacterium]|nr:hypothetical protein [Actinomycetes bacterium]
MSNFAPKRTTYETDDTRWLRDALRAEQHGVTVTTSSFDAGDIGTDGLVKSGSLISGEGLLRSNLVIKSGETHLVAAVHAGTVDRRYLPSALALADEESLSAVAFINGTVPTA